MTRWVFVLSVAVLLAAPTAFALQEPDDSPQHFTAGLRIGAMFLSSDDFEKIYGDQPVMAYGLGFGFKIIHHLEIIGEAGYATDRGTGIDYQGNETGEDYRIHFAPGSLGLLYRVDFAREQVVVPYLGGGLDGVFFYEERVRGGDKTQGGIYGWHGVFGLQFLLDTLDRRAANNLEDDYGINDVYFTVEGRYLSADDFGDNSDGDGMDLTNWFVTGGLMFQF